MKKLLFGVVALLVLGAACMLGAAVSTGFNMEALDIVAKDSKLYTAESAVQEVSIDNYDGRVQLVRGDKLTIAYSDSAYYRYTLEERDGRVSLSCRRTDKRFLLGWLPFAGIHMSRVVVQIPDGLDAVTVSNRNGKVTAADLTVRELKISTTNAHAELKNIKATGVVTASTTNGSIECADTDAQTLHVRTTNGSVELTDCRATAVEAETSNASVDLDTVTAGTMSLITTNGSVDFSALDVAEQLSIRTTNASIRGTLAGARSDYTFRTVHTTNGSCNIEAGGTGARQVDVHTTNGKINITFAKNE